VNVESLSLLSLLAPELLSDSKAALLDYAQQEPLDALVSITLVGAQLFFRAEHGSNPKVKSFNDALVFVTTNLSVGYCDIYAMTEPGKQIAALLMTIGPALAARAFDKSREQLAAEAREEEAYRGAMLAKLDQIAALLQQQNSMQPTRDHAIDQP
jgi:voltage-gated potassium channel